MTLDRQEWALLGDVADVVNRSDRTSFIEGLRHRLGHRPSQRRALVALIEELVSADAGLADVAPSVGVLLRSRMAADAVADALRPEPVDDDLEDAFTADDVLRLGRVRGQAEAAILAQPMLDASRVAALLGSRAHNPREFARQLRTRGDVVALRLGRRFLFPAFQFDQERGELRPLVAQINRTLEANQDPWGVSSFWFSRDAHSGVRPADLATSGRSEELEAAAQRELAPPG